MKPTQSWVTSEYSRQTFLAAGVPVGQNMRNRVLRVPEQFRPIEDRPSPDGVFRVVYIGSLSLRKGIPVLIDAFYRLGGKAELTLVGGSGSRGMRNFMAKAMGARSTDPDCSRRPDAPFAASRRLRPPNLRRRLRLRTNGGAGVRSSGYRHRRHRNEGARCGRQKRICCPHGRLDSAS